MINEILLMWFFAFVSYFFLLMKKRKHTKVPPGPGKIPIIVNLHQLGKLPHRSLHNLSKTYGDLMYLQLGLVPAIVVSSPDRAREIFKNYDLAFSGRRPTKASKKITYNFSSMSTAPYADYWREVRKIVVLELMTEKRVESFEQIRAQEVCKYVSGTVPGPVELSSIVFSLSNNVVCRVAFGTMNDPGNSNKFLEFLMRFSNCCRSLMWRTIFQGWAGLTGLMAWTGGSTGICRNWIGFSIKQSRNIVDVD